MMITDLSTALTGPFRAFLVAALTWGLALTVAPSVYAQEASLDIREVGWDGTIVPSTWSPIRVRASSGRQTLDGRVEVVLRLPSSRGVVTNEYPTVVYDTAVNLPAGASREVMVWIPTSTSLTGAVRLVAAGQVIVEEPLTTTMYRSTVWPLAGVLADSPAIARRLAQVTAHSMNPTVPLRVTELQPAEVPRNPERLAALSVLVVQGTSAGGLDADQRRAIQDWVAAGGQLLLIGGLHAPRPDNVLPRGVLPLVPTGVESAADLGPLARWSGERAVPAAAGPVARFRGQGAPLVGTADQALAWRFTLGQGGITVVGVDLELEPLASWGGSTALLTKAVEPALPPPGEDERRRASRLQERLVAQRLLGPLEALPSEAYPSWQQVALILGGFTLLAGPLAHIVLGRIDRRVWVWVLVPVLAMALSAGLYLFGIGRDGRDVLGNVVTYVRLDPDTGGARQSVAAGFFAPTQSLLQVTVPGDGSVRTAGRDDPGFAPSGSRATLVATPGEPLVRVLSGRDTRVVFNSNQWTMRTVTLERMLGPEVGRIAGRVVREGFAIRGEIRNDTHYLFENAIIAMGDCAASLGTLAPGEVAHVELRYSTNSLRPGAPLGWMLESAQGGPAPSSWDSPSPEMQRRARLLEVVLGSSRSGTPNPPAPQPLPLTFLAFTRQPVGDGLPHVGDRPTFHLTLVEQRLHAEGAPR